MEVRQQIVDPPELEAGRDEQLRAPRERRVARDRLQRAHGRRPDREHTLRRANPVPGRRVDLVALAVDVVLLDRLCLKRPERVETDVQRHPLDVQLREQPRREVQARRRRRRGAGIAREDGLVAPCVRERLGDVWGGRRNPVRIAVEADTPPPCAEVLEQLDLAVATTGAEAPRRPGERLPDVAVDALQQQHLAARAVDRNPRGHDARVVHDRQHVDELRQLAEHAMRDLAGGARVDEQTRFVAASRGLLRDQLRRQVVVELRRFHPTRTVASGSMDEIREALRHGLREEAAPISRRLAEVKGLSNNAIRRLENIESTLDAERSARVDDLALLVELLTEGWRAMNARLERIEAALQPPETNVVRLRDSA